MLNKIFHNRIFKFALVFIFSFILLFWFGNMLQELICGGLANTGNFIINLFGKSETLKLFPDNFNLILFSRHDNNLTLNPNFTYVISDIRTHFILPNVLFFSLMIALIKPFKSKTKPFLLGLFIVNLFFVIKFIVSVINNELKEIILNSKGEMINQIDCTDFLFKFFDILNNIFNKYGSIGLRPLIVVVIWIFVSFTTEEIKSFISPKNIN